MPYRLSLTTWISSPYNLAQNLSALKKCSMLNYQKADCCRFFKKMIYAMQYMNRVLKSNQPISFKIQRKNQQKQQKKKHPYKFSLFSPVGCHPSERCWDIQQSWIFSKWFWPCHYFKSIFKRVRVRTRPPKCTHMCSHMRRPVRAYLFITKMYFSY